MRRRKKRRRSRRRRRRIEAKHSHLGEPKLFLNTATFSLGNKQSPLTLQTTLGDAEGQDRRSEQLSLFYEALVPFI
jgi:hypothetical protein